MGVVPRACGLLVLSDVATIKTKIWKGKTEIMANEVIGVLNMRC